MQIRSPLTAFGELQTAQPFPLIQVDATTGLRTKTDLETFSATGGAVSATNTGTGYEFGCTTGTSVGGYGLIRSKYFGRYRPGQGIAIRFTARFPSTPVALSAVRAGGITSGTELSFGYDGTSFGVLYRTGGNLEARTLTISANATGNETATITLNNVAFTVSITNGTAAHNAYEIASATFTGWNVYQNGNTVIFIASAVGTKTSTFSFSSTGAAAGSFSQNVAGTAVTDTWIYQNSWNIDKCNGSGPSGLTLDVTKGNVYQIEYQYLGYGAITYSVENPGTGYFFPVHRIAYSNAYTSPHLLLPSLKVGWFAASLGSTSNLAVYGGSGCIFLQGQRNFFRNPESVDFSKTGVGTTLTNIISIRNRPLFNNTINANQIFLKLVAASSEGTKPVVCEVFINATVAGEPNWTYLDSSGSTVEYDTAGTTVTSNSNTVQVISLVLGKSDSKQIDLSGLNCRIARGETLTVAMKATSATSDVSASIVYIED